MSSLPQVQGLPQTYEAVPVQSYSVQMDQAYQAVSSAPAPGKGKRKNGVRTKKLPQILNGESPESNDNYCKLMQDPNFKLSPLALGFIPRGFWVNDSVSFGDLVNNFFQKKNNSNCRFPQKLYNALQIVSKNPEMWPYIGVAWVSEKIFKVDKYIFGRLLGISSFDGGLFHSQGNFPSHGFREVYNDAELSVDLTGVDFDRVRLITHTEVFAKDVDEVFVNQLKWNNNDITSKTL